MRRFLAALALGLAMVPLARAAEIGEPGEAAVSAVSVLAPALVQPMVAPALAPEIAAPASAAADSAEAQLPQAAAAPAEQPAASAAPAAVAARLSGQGPAQPQSPASQLYVLSRTIDRSVALGPVAQVAHYAVEVAIQTGKLVAAYHLGGVPAAVAVSLFEIPRLPVSVVGQSLLDLSQRSARARLKMLRAVAREPGVTGIKVLTGSELRFRGILAQRRDNHELVMIEATRPPTGLEARFGRAVPVPEPQKTSLRLRLTVAGQPQAVEWRPTLLDVLARRPPPPEVAGAWSAAIYESLRGLGWLRRLFGSRVARDTRVEAVLVSPDGGEQALGVLARGRAALRLAKGGKAVPMTAARVVSSPTQARPWRWLDALLGREIVVR